MKKQIAEVQKYFIDKITACEFDRYEIKQSDNGWFDLSVIIDECFFRFSVNPKIKICTSAFGFMDLKIPNDRLKNLIQFVTDHEAKIKAEKIEKLKAELEELTK